MKPLLLVGLYSLELFFVSYFLLYVEGMFVNALSKQTEIDIPENVLLDALDDQLFSSTRRYVQRRHAGLLMIPHQPMLAARADPILLLKEGQIYQSGTNNAMLQSENAYSNAIHNLPQPNG